MLDKLNFYDLLGYLIPGAAAIAIVYWVGTPVITDSIPGLSGSLPDFSSSVGGAILMVGFAYAMGHLVQAVGAIYEDGGNRRRKARISELMLDEKAGVFSPQLIELITARGEQAFKLPALPTLEGEYSSSSNIRLREFFDLCYRLIEQKSFNVLSDLYLAISGLSRGLQVVSWLGLAFGAALVLKEWVVRADATSPVAWFAYGVVGAFVLSWYLANRHFYRFRRYFAMSVWTNFLVASGPA